MCMIGRFHYLLSLASLPKYFVVSLEARLYSYVGLEMSRIGLQVD
jgi:hypothetical protein